MIHKLSFENFYSFMGKEEINLVVDKNAPDTDGYFTDHFGNRLTKFMAFVGPNASGKTNTLKSLAFIKWFITDSFTELSPEDEIAFKPFLFCSNSENRSSKFEIEFEIDKRIYKYELELTIKKVFSEKLSFKEDKRFKILFTRLWNKEKDGYELNFKHFGLPANIIQIKRNNASLLSIANQAGHEESLKIVKYFNNIETNIAEGGKINIGLSSEDIKYYHENPKLKAKAEEILSKFDLGFYKINIQKIQTHDQHFIYVSNVAHKYVDSNKEGSLPLWYESKGTQNLLFFLRKILVILEKGGVALLDEMDNDLHPAMVPEILNLFSSRTYNPKNAQLLFSTHSVQILNKLDKQQITLVEKNDKYISEAWNLSDVKGVRADDNFYAKYMAGAYGAFPKI